MKNRAVSAPYLLWMLIFIIVPLGIVVWFATTDKSGQLSFDNFAQLKQYAGVFGKSLWLAAISTVICLVMAYPLAYILSRQNLDGTKTMLTLVMLPMWMNFLLRTYAWMTILEDTGLLNHLIGLFGFGPIQMINTQGAVVLGMVYNYIPFMILPLYSVMTKIDGRVIEAAQDLGANNFWVFSRVIFPLSLPGVLSGVTMVFVPAVSTFIISKMLGGSGNLLIGDLIDMQFLGTSYNPNLGSALSLLLMAIILVFMGFLNRIDDDEMEGMIV